MSENLKRLEDMLEKINYIEQICDEKGGISKALDDVLRDRPAIFMFLMNINEQLKKIQDSLDFKILKAFDKDEIRGLNGVRNVIAHDYDGVNTALIENIIRHNLPKFKSKIQQLLKSKNNYLT